MIPMNGSLIRAGMVLAQPAYDENGMLLLDKDKVVTDKLVDGIRGRTVGKIFIYWPEVETGEVVEAVLEQTWNDTMELIKTNMDRASEGRTLQVSSIQDKVSEMVESIIKNQQTLMGLTHLRSVEAYTFGHSVNVCLLSLILGTGLGMSAEELNVLGTGAILHDIGKVLIDPAILNKPGKLTDEEFGEIKNHTSFKLEKIRSIQALHPSAIDIIRYHHERCDGTGYPMGLSQRSIPLMARIVAICDVYDALTSDRVYKGKTSPHFAVDYLTSMVDKQFDRELVELFLRHVQIYSIGETVTLSNGQKARVIGYNPSWPTRPVIKIQEDVDGTHIKNLVIVDLSKREDIEIST